VTTLAVAKVGLGAPEPAAAHRDKQAVASRTMSIAPQGVWASDMDAGGPVLRSSGSDGFRVSFVVPPDRGTRPLRVRVEYMESSRDACSWYAIGDGLAGPDGGATKQWVTGQWLIPGLDERGADRGARPGMFNKFGLTRNADSARDDCGELSVLGLELRY